MLVDGACCSNEVPEFKFPWLEYVDVLTVLERLEKVEE